MKKKGYSFERLTELERQVKEFSDGDLLDEAERLEQEMKKCENNEVFSDDFFDQVLIKAKEEEVN